MKKGCKTLAKISKLLNVCYNVEFQVPPGLENPEKSKGEGSMFSQNLQCTVLKC